MLLYSAACTRHPDHVDQPPPPLLDMGMPTPDAGGGTDMGPDLAPPGSKYGSCGHSAAPACGFAAPVVIARPPSPDNVATGDFNNDNKPDILVNAPPFVSVLLSNGDGTFKPQVDTRTMHVNDLIQGVADFNRDGKLDVLLEEDVQLVMWLGNGDGTFTRGPSQLRTNAGDNKIVVGDLNEDHIVDILLYHFAGIGLTPGDPPALYLGVGDGSFKAPSLLSGLDGWDVGGLTGADVDGDGHLDLVTTLSMRMSGATAFRVMFGNGQGGFDQTVDVSASDLGSVLAQDLNSDGKADLVMEHAGNVDVWISQGRSFKPVLTTPVAGTDAAKANLIADFDGDHKPDLITTNSAGYVAVLPGDGAGGFGAAVQHARADGAGFTIAAADFNSDGAADVVSMGPSALRVSAKSGDYELPAAAYVSSDLGDTDFADLNGDGLLDLVAFGHLTRTASSALQAKDGSFTVLRLPVYPTANTDDTGVVTGDFDHDSHMDALIPGQLLLGNGDGTFHAGTTIAPGNIVAAGDFNEDGYVDAVISKVQMQVGLSDSSGPLKRFVSYNVVPWLVRVADVNNDKHLDLVALVKDENDESDINVYLGAGDGSFTAMPEWNLPPALPAHNLALGDFNCDGKLDLLAEGTFFFGIGDGTFAKQPGDALQATAVGDFNHDGLLDGVSAIYESVQVGLGIGNGTLQPAVSLPGQASLEITDALTAQARDINGDGRPDIASTVSSKLTEVWMNSCTR
jgi:hypothetical protein